MYANETLPARWESASLGANTILALEETTVRTLNDNSMTELITLGVGPDRLVSASSDCLEDYGRNLDMTTLSR